MRIKVAMHELVSFEALHDPLRIIILRVRRQVHILGVIETRAGPWIMIRHHRDDFASRCRRSLVPHERGVLVDALLAGGSDSEARLSSCSRLGVADLSA